MVTSNTSSHRSALVVERDDSTARMIAAVLGRIGFSVHAVATCEEARSILGERTFQVIVWELNLAPAMRQEALRLVAGVPRQALRRTILMTTAAESMLQEPCIAEAFAILRKPFEIRDLIDAAEGCAARESHSAPEDEAADAVDRFVRDVPSLRKLLDASGGSKHELLVRGEMRQTIAALSSVLQHAAELEPPPKRRRFLAAAEKAAELSNAPSSPSGLRHDH